MTNSELTNHGIRISTRFNGPAIETPSLGLDTEPKYNVVTLVASNMAKTWPAIEREIPEGRYDIILDKIRRKVSVWTAWSERQAEVDWWPMPGAQIRTLALAMSKRGRYFTAWDLEKAFIDDYGSPEVKRSTLISYVMRTRASIKGMGQGDPILNVPHQTETTYQWNPAYRYLLIEGLAS